MARPKNALSDCGEGDRGRDRADRRAWTRGVQDAEVGRQPRCPRAPSLYHYFADKNALLTAVARVVATPAAPTTMPADADWTDYLMGVSADELFAIFLRTYLDGILREIPSRQPP